MYFGVLMQLNQKTIDSLLPACVNHDEVCCDDQFTVSSSETLLLINNEHYTEHHKIH